VATAGSVGKGSHVDFFNLQNRTFYNKTTMMKTFAALCILASASAFAPAQSSQKSLALNALIDESFGISVETGNKCPPLGRELLKDAGPEGIKWFQNAEIKHGRVAMVATIGFLTQKLGVHFPLYFGPTGSNCFHPESANDWMISFDGTTFSDLAKMAPLDAISSVPNAGLFQILIVGGWFESIAYNRQVKEGNEIPGDYGYDPLAFTKKEGGIASKDFESLRMKELKNGRVAM
jgi:light-harvesting complex I chlorophyll a/b binding protein 1/light-harvesting complex I chlorophyll a/b binding protein 4